MTLDDFLASEDPAKWDNIPDFSQPDSFDFSQPDTQQSDNTSGGDIFGVKPAGYFEGKPVMPKNWNPADYGFVPIDSPVVNQPDNFWDSPALRTTNEAATAPYIPSPNENSNLRTRLRQNADNTFDLTPTTAPAPAIETPSDQPTKTSAERALLPDSYDPNRQQPTVGDALAEAWAWNNSPLLGLEIPKLSGQQMQPVLDWLPFSKALNTAMPWLKPVVADIGAGAERTLAGAANFMLTPMGIELLGLGGAPALIQRTAAVYFAGLMASQVPEKMRDLGTALGRGDLGGASEALSGAALDLLFAGMAGKHAVKGSPFNPESPLLGIKDPTVLERLKEESPEFFKKAQAEHIGQALASEVSKPQFADTVKLISRIGFGAADRGQVGSFFSTEKTPEGWQPATPEQLAGETLPQREMQVPVAGQQQFDLEAYRRAYDQAYPPNLAIERTSNAPQIRQQPNVDQFQHLGNAEPLQGDGANRPDPTVIPERGASDGGGNRVVEGGQDQTAPAEVQAASPVTPEAVKPVELMTPDEARAAGVKLPAGRGADILPSMDMMAGDTLVASRVGDNMDHAIEVATAVRARKPVSAEAVDQYGIKLPNGYVREGDAYVFKPQSAIAETTPVVAPPLETPLTPKAEDPVAAAISRRARKSKAVKPVTVETPISTPPSTPPRMQKLETYYQNGLKAGEAQRKRDAALATRLLKYGSNALSVEHPDYRTESQAEFNRGYKDGANIADVPSATPAPAPARAPASEPISAVISRKKSKAVEPKAATESVVTPKPVAAKPPEPAGKKVSGTEQKKYLLSELDKAIADAPDEPVNKAGVSEADGDLAAFEDAIRPMGPNNYRVPIDDKNAAWESISGLAEKYGVKRAEHENTVTKNSDSNVALNDLEQAINAARQRQIRQRDGIVIEVPGDGVFTVINTKATLTQFRDTARKRFPTTTPKATEVKVQSGKASTTATVNSKPTVDDVVKVSTAAQYTDSDRPVLNYSVSDGTHIVSTDGQRMLIIEAKGLPGTPEELAWFDSKGKPVAQPEAEITDTKGKGTGEFNKLNYPNYKQVLPKKENLVFRGVDTAEMIKTLKQARLTKTAEEFDKDKSVVVVRNQDGTYGVSTKTAEGDSYSHNVQPDHFPVGAFNPEFLIDGLEAARRVGHEKVDWYQEDSLSPLALVAKGGKTAGNFEYVQMPFKLEGASNTPSRIPAVGEKAPALTVEAPSPDIGVGAAQIGVPPSRVRVSNKNAMVDQERIARGERPMMAALRQKAGHWWDQAMAMIDANDDWQDGLIRELLDKPRTLTAVEEFGLLHRRVDLGNELGKALVNWNEALAANDRRRLDHERLVVAQFTDRLDLLDKATKAAGSEWGRSGIARQQIMNESYEFQALVRQKRFDLGRDLTEGELKEVQRLSKELLDTQAKLEKAQAESAGKIGQAEVDRMIAEAKASASESKFSPGIIAKAEELVQKLKDSDMVRAARERLKGKLLSPNPQDIADLALLGSVHIAEGAVNIARFGERLSKQVSKQFWAEVQPFLDEIYAKAQAIHDDYLKNTAKSDGPAVKRFLKAKATIDERIDAAKEQIKTSFEKDESENIGPFVQKLVRAMVEANPKIKREVLVDQVHDILKTFDPEITRLESMDAISGRGTFTLPSQEVVSKTIRDLKTQIRLIGHQMDVVAKRPLPRTGPQRDKMSDAARREEQKLEEMKRKYGVVVTDPAKHLASVLGARKTYYRNRLADLRQEIKTKERIVKSKTPSPTDAELEGLRKELEAVQAEHDAIFGKREMTDAQRLEMLLAGAEKNLERWNTRLVNARKGVFDYSKKPGRKVSSKELEAIKAQTEAAKEQIQELKDASEIHQAQLEAKRINAQIAEYERKIKAGEVMPEQQPTAMKSPANQKLRDKLDLVREALAAMRKASPEYQADQIKSALEVVEQTNDELARRINEGDIAVKARKPTTWTSPELDAARAEHEQLNKIIQELRNASKPRKTPNEIALQSAKTRIANQTAELARRIADGDFAARPKRTIIPDAELNRAKIAHERVKIKYQKAREVDRLSKRNRQERWTDFALGWRRQFLLSGVTSLFKLTSAAVERVAFTGIEEGVGRGLQLVPGIRQIAKMAPSEGGGGVAIEARALAKSMTKGMADAWKTLRTGKSELDALYGKSLRPEDEMWQNVFGKIHGAIKSPVKRNHFERSLSKRLEFAARQGEDITDPLIQTKYAMKAYADGNRSIFLNDNIASEALNVVTAYLNTKGFAGKLGAGAMRWLLPIVKVPTNIVAEAFTYATGTVTGSFRVGKALVKGLDKLTPDEADSIMRQLKKGSLGGAVLLLGYFQADNIGGYYQPGQHDPKAVKHGGLRIFGYDIPRFLVHNPLLEMLQLGATVRHVARSKIKQSDAEPVGITMGIAHGLLGLAKEAPYMRTLAEGGKALDLRQLPDTFGKNVKAAVVPRLVQEIAERTDRDASGNLIQRKPKSTLQYVQSGIPALRSRVPIKQQP